MAATGRIRPPQTGLTEEAKAALNLESGAEPTDPEPDFAAEDVEASTGLPLFEEETGDYIDSPLRQRALPTPPPREAAKGIPALDEWMDFFSRIALRVICDWYISFAFRGIDENLLTERELDRLQLNDEERQRIAVPLSELSYKSKLMRKHGRTIIASGGAFDALITIGTWASRVNRIAHKYRPRTVQGRVVNDGTRQSPPQAGANGGSVDGGWPVYNPGG